MSKTFNIQASLNFSVVLNDEIIREILDPSNRVTMPGHFQLHLDTLPDDESRLVDIMKFMTRKWLKGELETQRYLSERHGGMTYAPVQVQVQGKSK